MMRVCRLGLAALAAAVLVGPAFAGNATVGGFYVEIAKLRNLGAADAVSAESSLRAAGFNLPALALGKNLTERDVVSISRTLGLSVTTTHPDAAVDEGRMNQFVSGLGTQLGAPVIGIGRPAPGGSGPTTNDLPPQSDNGKGKKKGHNKSTAEPI